MSQDEIVASGRPLDLVERCQKELFFQSRGSSSLPGWRLSRGAIDRLQEMDRARQRLPDSWRKLLCLANLTEPMRTAHPDLRLREEEYAELMSWSETLGESIPKEVLEPVKEKRTSAGGGLTRNNFAFAACLALFFGGLLAVWLTRPAPSLSSSTDAALLAAKDQANRELIAKNEELRQGQANGKILLKQKDDSLRNLQAKRADDQKIRRALEGRILVLQNQKPTVVIADRGPAVTLDFGATGSNTAGPGTWETSGPSYTSVRDVSPVFRWDPATVPERAVTVRVEVYRKRDRAKVITSNPVPAKDGKYRATFALPRGEKYEWLLVSDTEDVQWLRIPFYILSKEQNASLQAQLKKSSTAAERAVTLQRYGLLEELLGFGGAIEKDARAAMEKLAKK